MSFNIDQEALGKLAWEAARDTHGTEAEKTCSWEEALSEVDKQWWRAGAMAAWTAGALEAMVEMGKP